MWNQAQIQKNNLVRCSMSNQCNCLNFKSSEALNNGKSLPKAFLGFLLRLLMIKIKGKQSKVEWLKMKTNQKDKQVVIAGTNGKKTLSSRYNRKQSFYPKTIHNGSWIWMSTGGSLLNYRLWFTWNNSHILFLKKSNNWIISGSTTSKR